MLTPDEVRAVLAQLHGPSHLLALLLYGSGVRLLEALRLRVENLDFGRGELVVREGNGAKDRVTVLPEGARGPLSRHLERVRRVWLTDGTRGEARGWLPGALDRKAPGLAGLWAWF